MAIAFYVSRGYRYCEVPWIVPDDIARLTFNHEGLICQTRHPVIGSAEQGFLALPEQSDKLVSCSPCFRNEPVLDLLHQQTFMKVELFWSGAHLEEIIQDAKSFFQKHLDCYVVCTPEGWDIMANGIEIGSYGERKTVDRHWTYGTGLALPRFTIASC